MITSVPIRIGTIPLLPSIIERAENDRLNRHSAQTDNNHQEKMDLKSIVINFFAFFSFSVFL